MLREVAGGRGDFTVVNAIRIRRAIESYPDAEAIIARIDAAARAATADGAIRAILAAHL